MDPYGRTIHGQSGHVHGVLLPGRRLCMERGDYPLYLMVT